MQSFLELGVSARVAQALAERDIHAPFRIQGLVLPDALAGRDVLAKSPTGSGKTLAFAVPLVERLQPSDGRPSGARPGSHARAGCPGSRRARHHRPRV